jgi:hypothetical protein
MVALLMLQSLPASPPELLTRLAGEALFSPCPAVRFLAARLLGQVAERPTEKLREALEREPNSALKRQLEDLIKEGTGLPSAKQPMRLW